MKNIVRQLVPPVLWHVLSYAKRKLLQFKTSPITNNNARYQDLDVYWQPNMAEILERWGDGNVWSEIEFLLVNCRGRILDIACGTGKVIDSLSIYDFLDIYGCDISDLLIDEALKRGIAKDHVIVADATKLPYEDNFFDYAYSIGSLEHFTESGILDFLSECRRVVQKASFHQIPVSLSGKDEGWLTHDQSFFNNSVDWWLKRYSAVFNTVYVLKSCWKGDVSKGRWFICFHQKGP